MTVDPHLAVVRAGLTDPRHAELDSVTGTLETLERREREVSALRQRLHRRLDGFPNEVTQRHERRVSDERRALHGQIDQLRAHARSLALRIDPEAA